MSVRCPYCNYPNFDNAKTCRRCKKEIPDICPSCDAILQSQADFCPVCGELLDREEDLNTSSQTTKKNIVKPKEEAPAYSKPRPRELKDCVSCSRKIAASATFCPYCGHKFDKVDAISAKAPVELEETESAPPVAEKPSQPVTKPSKPVTMPGQVKKAAKSPSKPLPRPVKKEQKASEHAVPPPPRPVAKPMTEDAPKKPPKPKPISTGEEHGVSEEVTTGAALDQEPLVEPSPPSEVPPETDEKRPVQVEKESRPDPEVEEAKRLRASHISIKEVSNSKVKIRTPIDCPTYVEREFSVSAPQYATSVTDATGISVPEGMVLISGGSFQFGTSGKEKSIPAFLMDVYPVTCEEYYHFCIETKHRLPSDWVNIRFLTGKEKHPVTYVNLNDARAYAHWAGKRIPNEMEWEKAASGEKGWRYPWGDEFRPGMSHCRNSTVPKLTVPVDTFPENASIYGCKDMLGNAAEWTENKDTPNRQDAHPVLKGGCLFDRCGLITCQTKVVIQDAEFESACFGFRCVKDIEINV